METASIHLKFTPLIKNVVKNESSCCLEIIPEVSCIKNLDKMTWKRNIESIEYVIPLTYRIILKKKPTITEIEENNSGLDKTYHSCIDLLPPSSLTNIDLGSGDVPRNISDTFIISKFTANLDVGDTNEKNIKRSQQQTSYKLEKKSDHTIMGTKNVPKLPPNDCNKCIGVEYQRRDASTISTYQLEPYSTDSIVFKSMDKLNKTSSMHKAVSTRASSASSSKNCKRKLSISPICSIDTNNYVNYSPLPNIDIFSLSAVFDRIFEHDGRNFNNTSKINNLSFHELSPPKRKLPNDFDAVVNFLHPKPSRELPEIRVAKFVKEMESEIMPLKQMLNDILQKCSKLGIGEHLTMTKHVFTPRNVLLTKKQSQTKLNCIKKDKTSKCNRVVYSIVFDDGNCC